MYIIKEDANIDVINQSKLAEKVGIAQATMNRIFKGKQSCSKMTAYAITKLINENAEIEDYFKKKGE